MALTVVQATQHVMWRDEVRAFSVATRTSSWADLFASLRGEAHPVVWYAILRVAYDLSHSTLVLPTVSLAIAAAAAFLILRFAPFPVWLRLLCVFGVFLGHEYSVVCRNYGIGILLMMAACVMFPERHERPLRVGVALALLANTSIPGLIASLVISLVWVLDVLDSSSRSALLRPRSLAGLSIVFAGGLLAWISASPSPDMIYAFPLSHLGSKATLRAILTDPGDSLGGHFGASITAIEELPWARTGISGEVVSRIMVDVAVLSVGWSLRKSRPALVGFVLAIIIFEILFRVAYRSSLRHEGMLTFLMVSLAWIACRDPGTGDVPTRRNSIAFGLLPLLVFQSLALPVAVKRELTQPSSSSKAFARLVKATPRYRGAILMSEPDYLMETMPYYVPNPVFMPREREFSYRVYFDRGTRRLQDMRLGTLTTMADSVSCANGQPVLLAIGYDSFPAAGSATQALAFNGAFFRWNAQERAQFLAQGTLVAVFSGARSDENYSVFEIPRPGLSACDQSKTATAPPPG